MTIAKNVLEMIKEDDGLVFDLMRLHSRSFYTMKEWIKDAHPSLTTEDSLLLICQKLKMTREEVLIDDSLISKG